MASVWVFDDAEALGRAAAERIAEETRTAAAHGRFALLLAGGATPRRTYQFLAEPPLVDRVDWPQVHFFWGDERCLPTGDPRRNETMVRHALLDRLSLGPGQIHPISADIVPERAASDYAAELANFFAGGPPRFDLALLGLGADGHTASLLPGSEALGVRDRWTAISRRPEEDFSRVTLTVDLLNRSALVLFLVSGPGKARMVRSVLREPVPRPPLPAQLIRPTMGAVEWWLDREAAALLANGDGGD
jgi:6-phosphogluconolactonase